jgi:hypothetical protein
MMVNHGSSPRLHINLVASFYQAQSSTMVYNLASIVALLVALPTLAFSSPIVAAGSKHNVYLARCQHEDCSIFCDPDDSALTVAAYFSGGPITDGSTKLVTPTRLGRLTGQWEGAKKTVRLGTDGTLTTNIETSARTAKKGDIAGDATLGTEPFVCFKDGSTEFTIRYDDERYKCKTDYWCPSIEVGSST